MDTKPKTYECQRCGAETSLPADVVRQYCALCGVHGLELRPLKAPASTHARAPSSDRLLPCA